MRRLKCRSRRGLGIRSKVCGHLPSYMRSACSGYPGCMVLAVHMLVTRAVSSLMLRCCTGVVWRRQGDTPHLRHDWTVPDRKLPEEVLLHSFHPDTNLYESLQWQGLDKSAKILRQLVVQTLERCGVISGIYPSLCPSFSPKRSD